MQSYNISSTFPIAAISALSKDQTLSMLTNYNNNNGLEGKTKTLHRKDVSALLLLIHDIITELKSPAHNKTAAPTGKKQRIKEKYIRDTEMKESNSNEWPDDIDDMYQLNYDEYLELDDPTVVKYIKACTKYFNVICVVYTSRTQRQMNANKTCLQRWWNSISLKINES